MAFVDEDLSVSRLRADADAWDLPGKDQMVRATKFPDPYQRWSRGQYRASVRDRVNEITWVGGLPCVAVTGVGALCLNGRALQTAT